MHKIESEQSVKFKNLISYRKEVEQSEINKELKRLGDYLKENNLIKVGPLISTTHASVSKNQSQLLDMEFLVPIDKEITGDKQFKFKHKFSIVHALRKRYKGNIYDINCAYEELVSHIKDNNLHQITSAYSININEDEVLLGAQPIIDIYIGINPCSL